MDSAQVTTNPYVGPRVFKAEEQDLFFGRDKEARDLLSLIVSQRLVLFYAQSGAGKSSLIQARILPGLKERGYTVLPIGRVGAELPAGADRVNNAYAFDLMLSLDRGGSDPARFAHLTLADFLANLTSDDGEHFYYAAPDKNAAASPRVDAAASAATEPVTQDYHEPNYVLIVDQFEEIFTTHVERWEDRAKFFEQLNEAMTVDPKLWVLLALREDYVAALDPYAHLLSDKMRARYYMQRMDEKAALQAVQEPAKRRGRLFREGVAEKLVENLRQIRVQDETEPEIGQYVEPVQLQVVCYQLWESLPSSSTEITEADLKQAGDVDRALTAFYETAIADVLKKRPDISDEQLRLWFSNNLITQAGTRGIVFRGPAETAGMPNAVVKLLSDRYLLHIEPRAGADWVELVHDRFIDPIRQANRTAEANDEVRRVAEKEVQAARQREFEKAQALAEAERLRAEEQTRTAARLRQRAVYLIGALVAALLLGVAAGGFGLQANQSANAEATLASQNAAIAKTAQAASTKSVSDANNLATARADALEQRDEAQRQTRNARSHALVAQSLLHLNDDPSLALLLGLEAYRVMDTFETYSALLSGLQRPGPWPESVLHGHSDSVWTIAFSPDGKTLASGSGDGTIILWDVSNPATPVRLGAPFTDHNGEIASVAFSPDGKTLASGNTDWTIILWDVSNPKAPKPRGTLRGHQNAVQTVAFSPDGKTLASGSDDTTIILWDVSNPETPIQLGKPLTGHKARVGIVAFSPDGKTLASGSTDNTIILWDVSNPKATKMLGKPLTDHTGDVVSVAFSPDGRLLASGSHDQTVILWDVSNPATPVKIGAPLTGHAGTVESVAFSPDGTTLASSSGDKTIILWDVSNPNAPAKIGTPLVGHTASAWILAFSPDGKTLASGSRDQTIILWNLKPPGLLLASLNGHTDAVYSVAFSPDGKMLASSSGDKTVILWDVSNAKAPVQKGTPLADTADVYSVAFSPDGQTLASGGCGTRNSSGPCALGQVILWDVSNLKAAVLVSMPLTDLVLSVAFSPDGKTLVTGGGCDQPNDNGTCTRGRVILWDVSNRKAPTVLGKPLIGYTDLVLSVAFSRDGKTLATSSRDGAIILWDVTNLSAPTQLGAPLSGHTYGVASVAFSPDDQTLASGSWDTTVRLWNVATRQLGALLAGNTDYVLSVAFSPDGQTLASGSWDTTVRLWNIANPQASASLIGHTGAVRSVIFSPDGKMLASASDDKSIRLWDVDPASWYTRACQLAGRNLTRAEWQQYLGDQPYGKTCSQWPLEEQVTPTPAP